MCYLILRVKSHLSITDILELVSSVHARVPPPNQMPFRSARTSIIFPFPSHSQAFSHANLTLAVFIPSSVPLGYLKSLLYLFLGLVVERSRRMMRIRCPYGRTMSFLREKMPSNCFGKPAEELYIRSALSTITLPHPTRLYRQGTHRTSCSPTKSSFSSRKNLRKMSYEVLVQLLLETRYACLLGVVLFTKICRCDTILQGDIGPASVTLVGFCAVCKN